MKYAIFLDRDGTLNDDAGYTHKIEDWIWLPRALEGLREMTRRKWTLVVVSNQSGIGRGYYDYSHLKKLEEELNKELAERQIHIAGWYYCPHLPTEHCSCRKPEPGMLLQAARELNISLPQSWMIGDRISDIEAGQAAGCKTGLIMNYRYPNETVKTKEQYPKTRVWNNLKEAANAIGSPPPSRIWS